MKTICFVLLCVLAWASAANASSWRLHWADKNSPRCTAYNVYRDGVLAATTPDTAYVDSTASVSTRHSYYVIGIRNGKQSVPSPTATGLKLDWTQGSTDCMEVRQRTNASTLLLVMLPYSRWTINWAYSPPVAERVIGHCDYDFDFNNGKLNLSDFCFFSTYWTNTPVALRADEVRRFHNCYQRQERIEWSK